MEARLIWEQETPFICASVRDKRFNSEVSEFLNHNTVVEGWSPKSA